MKDPKDMTRDEKLSELARLNAIWVRRHLDTPASPDHIDGGIHHVDWNCSDEAEIEFQRAVAHLFPKD